MIKFTPTVETDTPLIQSWVDADSWNHHKNIDWWINDPCYLRFKLEDDEGVVIFVRFDQEGETMVRLHSQFGPVSQVSENRVATAISESMPRFITQAKTNGVTGIVTESVSPKLIMFLCSRLRFKPDTGDDYKLVFSEDK
jgi:hypothetical protein